MMQLNRINDTKDRVCRSLSLSIEHFRKSNDQFGLEMFLNFIEDLENLSDIVSYQAYHEINLNKIIPALQKLYTSIQNQDITAMTDILEYTIYPLLKEEW